MSSSTSIIFSSSYDYEFSSLFDNTYEQLVTSAAALPPPFCPGFTHPLVYYAEIQPKCRGRPPGKERKPKRNCFARAFRWYSQEQKTVKGKGSLDPSSFASWLDAKYSEYIQESEAEPLRQQPSLHEQVSPPCRKTRRKRFCGLKRPWSKRSSHVLMEAEPQKSQQGSCHFVLQPKDLTQPPSEFCYATPTSAQKIAWPTEQTLDKSHCVTSINYENASNNCFCEDNTNAHHTKGVKRTNLTNTPCDPRCRHSGACIGAQIQRALEKLQTAEPLCDPNCAGIPQHESDGEKQQASAKINMRNSICIPNKANGVELENVATKTLIVVSSPSTGCDPDCKLLKEVRSLVATNDFNNAKTQEIENRCDASCHTLESKKTAHKKKLTQGMEHVSSSATDLKTKRKASNTALPERIPAIGSGKNISGKKSEPKAGFVCSKARKIFCSNSSCTLGSKLKSKKSKHVGSKKMELPCDSNCPYFSELKNLQKKRKSSSPKGSARSTQKKIYCECNRYYKETQLDPPKTQNISAPDASLSSNQQTNMETKTTAEALLMTSCDPDCKYRIKRPTDLETSSTPKKFSYEDTCKTQNITAPCDPICWTLPSTRPTVLETKATAETFKCEAPCVTVDKTQLVVVGKTDSAHRTPLKETVCDTSCSYLRVTLNIPRDYKRGSVFEFKASSDPPCAHDNQQIQIKRTSSKQEIGDEIQKSYPCCEINQEIKNEVKIPISVQQSCLAHNYITSQDIKKMDEVEATTNQFVICECDVVKPATCDLNEMKQSPVARLKIDNHCDPTCIEGSSKMNDQKVPSIQKTNHSCQYPEYQAISIKVEDQFEGHLNAIDPANTTENKYILIPENKVIPFMSQCQCEGSCHVAPTNIPFQLIMFEKLVLPEKTNTCNYPEHIRPEATNRPSILKQTTTREVACQYSLQDVNVQGSISQYEQSKFNYYYDRSCHCAKAESETIKMVINEEQTSSYTTKNVMLPRKLSRSLSTHRSGGMQTSDHSIRLEEDTGTDYAFFMKIVCADKLSDCNCEKST